ncbi:hypothetical protein PWT90_09573 [Aphanocladium album]|nr:hypothetical protein PWT90_09573 [Aphanocladium album]
MALPPKFAGHKLLFAPPPIEPSSVPHATHTLELYLDYTCPFSAKLFRALQTVVMPLVQANPAWSKNLAVIFRQQVQPWHPSSTLTHEAGLAVLQLQPAKFWEFSAALFDAQKTFFDINVVNETRNETYKRLAKIAGGVGVDEAQVYKLLAIPDKAESQDALNVGNAVTNDLKVVTKMNRLIGVHVTPTGVFDGVVQDIGSSWGESGVRVPATQCAQLLRPRGHAVVFRLYSSKTPSSPSKIAEEVSKRQAGGAAKTKVNPAADIPERILIYHAGTGRTTFLAMLKVTTLFIGAFFCCVAIPSYIKADKPVEETAKIALCGVVPFLFVTYTTSPFVTHMHIHLPAAARTSRAVLERFVRAGMPPSTPVTVTTMSAIGKPRYSTMQAGDFVPARQRFGLVNYTRNTAAENASRKWYELRAVSRFHVPDAGVKVSKAKKGERNLVEPWIWDVIKEKVAKRNGPPGGAS